MKRTIDFTDLSLGNAASLVTTLLDNSKAHQIELATVYIQDDEGRQFSKARLVEETLTDGSKVHNLILSD